MASIPAQAALGDPDTGEGVRRAAPTKAERLVAGQRPRAVPGELIVRFAPGASSVERREALLRRSARVTERIAGSRIALVRLAPGTDEATEARELLASGVAWAAERNWIAEPLETIPNDPDFDQQWGLRNVGQLHLIADPPPSNVAGLSDRDADVSNAWDVTQGAQSTVIAVIDTGVDVTHPDLDDNIWLNADEIPANGDDDDGNGFIDDVRGWDFVGSDANPNDTVGHGTHVAGIVAAEADNATGGAGVCPLCTVMPLRAGTGNGIDLFDAIQAVRYAVRNRADIMNMSFGGPVWSKLFRKALEQAGRAGVLTVAAAGNEDRDNDLLDWSGGGGPPLGPVYPASYGLTSIVSVAATNDRDRYGYHTGCRLSGSSGCDFTNWGNASVDLAAPGVDIFSTVPSGGYGIANGTSMASPFVAGVAGLVESLHPSYAPARLRNALLRSVNHRPTLTRGLTLTGGRVNARAALNGSTAAFGNPGDDTMQGARTISRTARGALADPMDENDIFKIRLRKGHRYEVALQVPSGRDFDLFIWKPGALDTWPTTYSCGSISCFFQDASVRGPGSDEAATFVARKNGVYYLHVAADRGSGSYRLTISR